MSTLSSRLPAFPASFFGMVLGLASLGGAWRAAAQLWALPALIGEVISLAASALWLVLLVLYIVKWVLYREAVRSEARHPIACCFIGVIPVSAALVALAIRRYEPACATVLAMFGIVGQLAFGVWRTGGLWQGGRDPSGTTPVLYLPTVAGSFVSAIVLSAWGHAAWGMPFFGAGLLSWLAIESVIVHRLYTTSELPLAMRPTLGIQLAPPAVGALAYLSLISGPPDFVFQALLGYALLQALVLLRLLPWILRQPFSAAYWAFSFGTAALGADVVQFVRRGGTGILSDAAPYIFTLCSLVIGLLVLGTIRLLWRDQLLPVPAVAIAPVVPTPAVAAVAVAALPAERR